MAVRPPAPVQPGDRLLADVAALGEADGLLDDAGLGGHHRVVHVVVQTRDAGLDPDDLGRLLVGRRDSERDEHRRHRRTILRGGDHVDAEHRPDQPDGDRAEHRGDVIVGVLAERRGQRGRHPRADHAVQALLERALVHLGGEADQVAAEVVEQRLQPAALAEQQQLGAVALVVDREDPQVADDLALRRQQRRVAAVTGGQRQHVGGHLAGQELAGLGAGQGELAALRAIDGRARRRQGAVLVRSSPGVGRGVDPGRGRRFVHRDLP